MLCKSDKPSIIIIIIISRCLSVVPRVRWLGHAARKPNDVMVKQMLFAHSNPGHPRPMGRPRLSWMDTAMHDMGSLGRTLQIDLPRDWANLALHRDV